MRLLHADSLIIHDFTGRAVPPYAILSHTWGEGEVSFKDITKDRATGLKGSAELSEAINSMYRWYREAQICYAYLEDVTLSPSLKPNDATLEQASFSSSRWFSRGWTLQELIAPPVVVFYSNKWTELGNRENLRETISRTTGIDARALDGCLSEFSVAQKMSWASKRKTTRIEDEAYCLLGLFGVSMPLIYGEGRKAFRRLQEEIIKQSDDETIFAWARNDAYGMLLASSPSFFEASGSFIRADNMGEDSQGQLARDSLPFTVTNKGVQISLPVIENQFSTRNRDEYVAIVLYRETGTGSTYTRYRDWLVPISAYRIPSNTIIQQILISTKAEVDEDYLGRSMDGRLVIIQPFPAILAPITFVRMVQPEGRYTYGSPHFHDDGALSIMSPPKYLLFGQHHEHYKQNPLVVVFRSSQGATILISVAPIPNQTMIATISSHNRNAAGRWCFDRAKHDISEHDRGRVVAKILASGPDTTPLSVSANVRDADHACIVTIQTI
ncbi:hypothetical protein NUW58_g8212 [Xylaria curta]|uniref:Uncharacterized protein n=1 Tax=Xylaria curta TaxID=42375 RepID=A0ACC1NBT8_9PEZI|nr:hypothetical protein NUW58_g8212 [Xylaria curta]